jgi:TPR repeat protein
MKEMSEDDVRTALDLLEKGDVRTAEDLLRQTADAGDADACRILAREYRHGFHLSVDGDNEIRYMQRAAEKGCLIDCCFMVLFTASGLDARIKKRPYQGV